jgi:polysaccharide pyruvyl transferase WcaK-like protein
MKQIVLWSPSVSSLNLGDGVITDGVKKQLDYILKGNLVVEVSTHLPLSHYYGRFFKDFDLKFVCGSNLLKSSLFGLNAQWDIKPWQKKIAGPAVLVGVGWWRYGNKPNLYTRLLLRSVLSKEIIHSVRDQYTEDILRGIGIPNVLNTGCASMWDLTPEHCAKIPQAKADNVVFTLTDYRTDIINDTLLIKALLRNYRFVYFWPQGSGDARYFESLDVDHAKISWVEPSLSKYNELLRDVDDIEFVGTRLHGGIRAMQYLKRTMIIAVDNRAMEKHKDFNIPILSRDDCRRLDEILPQAFATQITLPEEKIKRWKDQFLSMK